MLPWLFVVLLVLNAVLFYWGYERERSQEPAQLALPQTTYQIQLLSEVDHLRGVKKEATVAEDLTGDFLEPGEAWGVELNDESIPDVVLPAPTVDAEFEVKRDEAAVDEASGLVTGPMLPEFGISESEATEISDGLVGSDNPEYDNAKTDEGSGLERNQDVSGKRSADAVDDVVQ